MQLECNWLNFVTDTFETVVAPSFPMRNKNLAWRNESKKFVVLRRGKVLHVALSETIH